MPNPKMMPVQRRPLAKTAEKPAAPTKTVSIVVAARNYGQFLKPCLESCLRQGCEVVYSDDGSTDDSVAIARSLGVPVLLGDHRGVVAARNRGAAATSGDILIFVDGDDMLTDGYVAAMRKYLRRDMPFVYGNNQRFGDSNGRTTAPAWSLSRLWDRNFCNTSSAIWRWAFEAAGRWQDTPDNTLWDWSLFLRASRFGSATKTPAVLAYRQHQASWSVTEGCRSGKVEQSELFARLRRSVVKITVGCLYSGRLPALWGDWTKRIVLNCRNAGIEPEFVVVDNSPGVEARWLGDRVKIVPLSGKPKPGNKDSVSRFIADAYNLLLSASTGEIVILVEDDVIPPPDAFSRMLATLLSASPRLPACTALYRSRHADRFVGGWWIDGRHDAFTEPPGNEPFTVDLAGTGCLAFWRDLCPAFDQSHVGRIPAHDWAWSLAVKERNDGICVTALPDVICRHHSTETEWV